MSKSPYAHVDTDVVHLGTKLIMPAEPAPMSYDEGITLLQRKKKEDEAAVDVDERLQVFPFDGAIALMKAMKEQFGWATPVPTPGFFGPEPPTFASVPIGPKETTQVVWGSFAVPGIDGRLSTGVYKDPENRRLFRIAGTIRRKHMPLFRKLADLTRRIAEEQSIYRSKAIHLVTKPDGTISEDPPRFLDLGNVNPEELTFSDDIRQLVDTNLFTPIEKTAACRAAKVPLKRGVLLAGPFGTGKTLTAFVAATKAVKNGWTFILVDRSSALKDALAFARLYQPAVVFAEDIDRAISGETRTVKIDDLLNTIDGIESKGTEILVVLTTNDLHSISPAMLRPGRLDAIIPVEAPDAKAAEKLMRIYGRGLIKDDEDLTAAGEAMRGRIPAAIRECVERAKLFAISVNEDGSTGLTCSALVGSARQMQAHLDLLAGKQQSKLSHAHVLGEALASVVKEHALNGHGEMIAMTEKGVKTLIEKLT